MQLAAAGAYRVLRLSGLEPGAEFVRAEEEAHKLGARVELIDRDVTETFGRLRDAVSLADVLKLVTDPAAASAPVPPDLAELLRGAEDGRDLEAAVERLKDRRKVRALVSFCRSVLPGAVRVMLDERDEYMASRLASLDGSVVAIVGLAHMDGIERILRGA